MATPQNGVNGAPASVSTPSAPVQDDYNASENIVRVRNVKRTYYIGDNPVHALRGINLDIRGHHGAFGKRKIHAVQHGRRPR